MKITVNEPKKIDFSKVELGSVIEVRKGLEEATDEFYQVIKGSGTHYMLLYLNDMMVMYRNHYFKSIPELLNTFLVDCQGKNFDIVLSKNVELVLNKTQ